MCVWLTDSTPEPQCFCAKGDIASWTAVLPPNRAGSSQGLCVACLACQGALGQRRRTPEMLGVPRAMNPPS